MTDDPIRQRLRAADPAGPNGSARPGGTPLPDLLEHIMTTATEPAASESQRPRRRAVWAAAAAAVVAGAAVTSVAIARHDGGSASKARTVTTLSVPAPAGPAAGGSCLALSVAALGSAGLAFSGTVRAIGDGSVEIAVDHWYRGDAGGDVRLTTAAEGPVVLEGGVEFRTGERYLMTATDGVVAACGFSAPWSAELAGQFEQAFGH